MSSALKALKNGHPQKVRRGSLDMAGDLRETDAKGQTALHCACASSRLDELRSLLERSTFIDHPNKVIALFQRSE